MTKFWNFQNKTDSEEIELLIEGDIIDYDDVWLYEWFGIPHVGKNKFRNELNKYKDKDIVVKIDSNGGNVWAATGIYDSLKEHSGKVTVKITRAASASTITAMAGDEVLISAVGLFMIHNPFPADGVFGDANALRDAADMLDTVKDIIINAYMTKTNLSKDEIWSMMDNETLMSAQMAVEKGFADAIIGDPKEMPEVSNKGFTFSRLAVVNSANSSIKNAITKIIAEKNKNQNKDGEEELEIKNAEDLRNAYPEFVKEIEDSAKSEGAEQERARIKDIEEISNNITPDLLNKAKFEEPMNAKDLAFEAMKADKFKGEEHLENTLNDNKNSGANNVDAGTGEEEKKPKNIQDKAANIVAMYDAKRRGVKVNG